MLRLASLLMMLPTSTIIKSRVAENVTSNYQELEWNNIGIYGDDKS